MCGYLMAIFIWLNGRLRTKRGTRPSCRKRYQNHPATTTNRQARRCTIHPARSFPSTAIIYRNRGLAACLSPTTDLCRLLQTFRLRRWRGIGPGPGPPTDAIDGRKCTVRPEKIPVFWRRTVLAIQRHLLTPASTSLSVSFY